MVSDHAPLLLSCVNEPNSRRQFKIELFWLSNPQAAEIIKESWTDRNPTQVNGVNRFTKNCRVMHTRLRAWHCNNFSEIETQLGCCKKTLLFFDQIEEHRVLRQYERIFQIKVRERAYKLSCIIESRWHHRSRCKWLQQGDKNTRYFHAVASARHRRNKVSTLLHQEQVLTNEDLIRNAFKE